MHLTKSDVCLSVYRLPMYVVAIHFVLEDKHTHVGHRTQVSELADLVLKEPFIEQPEEEPLRQRCTQSRKR